MNEEVEATEEGERNLFSSAAERALQIAADDDETYHNGKHNKYGDAEAVRATR